MEGAGSQAELGRLLGVSQQAVAKLVKHEGWPVKRSGPWSGAEVLAVVRWHEGLQEDRSAPMGSGVDDLTRLLKQATIACKMEQSKTAKLKREMLERERVTREMFEGALGGLAAVMVEVVEGWRLSIPSRFPGVDPEGLDLILDSGLRRLADKTEVEARSVDEVVMAAKRGRRGRPRAG